MYNRDERPLGAVAENAYETLLETTEPGEGILRDDANKRLFEAGFTAGDAEYALDRLLNRGYLYAVDDQLFVTDDDDYE